jgi:hypothetical protein
LPGFAPSSPYSWNILLLIALLCFCFINNYEVQENYLPVLSSWFLFTNISYVMSQEITLHSRKKKYYCRKMCILLPAYVHIALDWTYVIKAWYVGLICFFGVDAHLMIVFRFKLYSYLSIVVACCPKY